jgi:alpha-methylacyl-CoA racemase
MGPLKGYRIVELGGIGPAPFCAMLLADMGAEVIRVDRISPSGLGLEMETRYDVLGRNRRSVAVDLKSPQGVAALFKLIAKADALIEGFRPGVMEKLGLGPEQCWERNARLVYGRMTGWGQTGPWAGAAGHDINYISLSGALHAIGPRDGPPVFPLNLVGDFGGGGMFLAVGVLAAILEAKGSGKGQVVDSSMVEGSAYLMMMFYGLSASGQWKPQRGRNIVDGGSHFYGVYETKDGKFVSIGSIEGKFYEQLCHHSGADPEMLDDQLDVETWPAKRAYLESVFKSKTRAEWDAIMAKTDVCYAPVLDFDEAIAHPQNKARQSFIELDGVPQPAPAPRFSRTPSEVTLPVPEEGQHTREILSVWGLSEEEIEGLVNSGAVKQA